MDSDPLWRVPTRLLDDPGTALTTLAASVAIIADTPENFASYVAAESQKWRKVVNPLLETVCAENNGDIFHQNLFPLPEATAPDF